MCAKAALLVRCLAAFVVCSVSFSGWAETFEELKQLTEQGNAFTQAMLGAMFYQCEGVSQDYEQSLEWLTKAA